MYSLCMDHIWPMYDLYMGYIWPYVHICQVTLPGFLSMLTCAVDQSDKIVRNIWRTAGFSWQKYDLDLAKVNSTTNVLVT